MFNQREYFDTLLDDFKERAESVKGYEGYEPDKEEIEEFRKTMLSPYIVKIMESGIFHKGGLKGKKLTVAGPPDYQVFPISNLDDLIEILSTDLETFKTHWQKIEEELERVERNFLKLQEYLTLYLGARAASKAKNMKQQITSWKDEILQRREGSHPAMDIATHLFKFVPDAPALTIANRTKELLTVFNIEPYNTGTLRKKISQLKKELLRKVKG